MTILPQRIEPFVVLTTTTDQDLANRMCGAIEDTGIPILLEHVRLQEVNSIVSGFRLLAPPQFRESATRIVDLHLATHQTKLLVTLRTENLV